VGHDVRVRVRSAARRQLGLVHAIAEVARSRRHRSGKWNVATDSELVVPVAEARLLRIESMAVGRSTTGTVYTLPAKARFEAMPH
jgi:hypothetical protein